MCQVNLTNVPPLPHATFLGILFFTCNCNDTAIRLLHSIASDSLSETMNNVPFCRSFISNLHSYVLKRNRICEQIQQRIFRRAITSYVIIMQVCTRCLRKSLRALNNCQVVENARKESKMSQVFQLFKNYLFLFHFFSGWNNVISLI